ncbi:MAG: hypothetical protein SNJ73_05770 [Acetobacteraceae bacterium]
MTEDGPAGRDAAGRGAAGPGGSLVGRLWRGEVPLARTFWDWGVIGGLMVNMSTSFAFWLLLMEERLLAAYLIGYLLSNAYNLLIGVAIWRAVGREVADPARAFRIRLVTLLLLAVAVVT